MTLEPNAKPVNIRIKSGGESHSNLSSLKESSCLKDLWELRQDGRLTRWLSQIDQDILSLKVKPIIDKNDYNSVTDKEKVEFLLFFFDDINPEVDTEYSILERWNRDDNPRTLFLGEDYLRAIMSSEKEIPDEDLNRMFLSLTLVSLMAMRLSS